MDEKNLLSIVKKYLSVIAVIMLLACFGTTQNVYAQSATTTYKVGDVYNQNGLKGIVVDVDASGIHGKIMSFESSKAKWISNKDIKFETNAFYEDDGQKNMDVIEAYIQNNNTSWSEFPIFSWARSLGEGWYIPAKEEALTIWKNMNGGSNTYSKRTFKAFDKKQRGHGGDPLVDTRFYIGSKQPFYWYTSTETDGGGVLAVQFGNDFKSQVTIGFNSTFKAFPVNKSPLTMNLFRSRAIHKF